jgi:hypothetical protein
MFETIWETALPLFSLACALSVLLIEKVHNSQTSKLGRIVLVLSTLGLVTTFFIERLKQEKAEQEELAQTRQILERIAYLRLTVELTLETNHPELASYRRILLQNADVCLTETASRTPASFRISDNCLPKESTLAAALTGFVASLEIYRDDASTCDAPKPQGPGQGPDLAGRFPAALEDGKIHLEYSPKEDRFILYARNLQHDLYDLEPSGDITSVPDLKNARVFLRFSPLDGRGTEIYKSIRPKGITLQFVSPRYLKREIAQDQLVEIPGDRLPNYVYCFQDV